MTGSVFVVALLVHAASEGVALGALLGRRRTGRAVPWTAVACLSPVADAFVTSALPIPDGLLPVLLAFVAGGRGDDPHRGRRPHGRRLPLKVVRRRAPEIA
ncbi:hypothetical protein FXW78_25300 [Rhodococcus opacus]|nr:hypothetical protein [Rhodococcus opacus]